MESVLERHITWYTHKNQGAAECPICAIFVVCRGVVRDYERMLGGDADKRTVDEERVVTAYEVLEDEVGIGSPI